MDRRAAAVFGAVLGMLATAGVASGQEKSASDVFESVSGSVVVLLAVDAQGQPVSQGSGVVIEPGVVVSNCHVVRQADSATVKHAGRSYRAELRHADAERDVCSFSVAGLRAPAVSLGSTSKLKVGQRVYAIGAPQGLELSLSDGLISSLRPVPGGQYLQITAPISPGSSGGGLFDGQGRLIGLPTLFLEGSQQLNFAVPVEWITALPQRHDSAAGQTAAASSPDDLNRAIALADRGDWQALRVHAEDWLRREPHAALAWSALGLAYARLAEYLSAIDALQQALRIDPEFALAWSNLGRAYARINQHQKAIDAYQQALRIDPDDAVAWSALGLAHFDLAEYLSAIDAYQKALRIDPELTAAWANLGFAYAGINQHQKALEAARQALRIDPDDESAWTLLGSTHGKLAEYLSAIDALQQALRINPESAVAWGNLGLAYVGTNQYQKALEAAQQALRIDAKNAQAWFALGFAYKQLGQRSEMMDAYRHLRQLDPAQADRFFDVVIDP